MEVPLAKKEWIRACISTATRGYQPMNKFGNLSFCQFHIDFTKIPLLSIIIYAHVVINYQVQFYPYVSVFAYNFIVIDKFIEFDKICYVFISSYVAIIMV